MFYEPRNGHGLPHNPFNAVVTPRPIGWISTRDSEGNDNLAPYSFFNAVAYEPPQVMFASTGSKQDRDGTKDTVGNIRETCEFCVNIVEYKMRDKMNSTSGAYGRETDEFTQGEIEKSECSVISAARVFSAPANLECKLTKIVQLPGEKNMVVFGEVVGVHLRDDCLVDGVFDVSLFSPLARLGYRDYARIEKKFSLTRPNE